uniref:Uncharacterized protein n=1 Tax=Rhizophora mucronata TaxID=61149 RepID=A0A2P2N5H7_RHIMU
MCFLLLSDKRELRGHCFGARLSCYKTDFLCNNCILVFCDANH